MHHSPIHQPLFSWPPCVWRTHAGFFTRSSFTSLPIIAPTCVNSPIRSFPISILTEDRQSVETDQSDVADVEPHVGQRLVVGQGEGALKAGQGHVVLLRVEAAQPQVVEELGVVHPHL